MIWSVVTDIGRAGSSSLLHYADRYNIGMPGATAGDEPGFTAAVSAITDAFGDPTRRRIYVFLRHQTTAEGVTAAVVAAEAGVHPNVARHHLDKLAAGGYVEVAARTTPAERRAGRPSKRYVAMPVTGASELPALRSDDLVLALLGQALARLPGAEAEAMAEEVGATYGRTLAAGLTGDALAAGQRSLRSAMQAVAVALTAHGFAARIDSPGRGRPAGADRLRIISDHCPFGDLAVDHPVLCAVDRGLVRGMLTALYPAGAGLAVDTESSRAWGDTVCATAV
jgi:predicted ArsR family transcriptional regulator